MSSSTTPATGHTTLAEAMTGPVFVPGSPGYAEEVAGFNLVHAHTPEVVAGVASPEDVAVAVRYAADHRLPVSVQATGHGSNVTIRGGLLISTRRLDAVRVDPEAGTATVGAGVRWRAVIDAAAPYGLAPLSGSSSDVGAVGYTLGGGLPVLGRVFGYSADLVRSIEVVTPDGRLRETDAEHDPELFWGLRGGKGNLGVVTTMTVGLVPLSEVYGGGIFFAAEHIAAVLEAYREWSPTLPDHCCTSVGVLRLPPRPEIPEPLRGGPVAHLRVCHAGDPDEGERLLAPMRAVAPALMGGVAPMPVTAIDAIHQDPDHPVPFFERSSLLRELGADTVAALVERTGPESGCPLLLAEVRQLGGALSGRPEPANAVCGRDAAYCLLAIAVPPPPGPDGTAPDPGPLVAAADGLMEALAPWSTGQTLLNMHGVPGDEADRARAWEPDTHRRLRELRGIHDPAGLLQAGHVIGAG